MIQEQNKKSRIFRLCWSVFIAALFILVHGYTFNGGDQEEHLPYVYEILDPALYPNDYLVPFQDTHFTVRFYYAHLVAFLASWMRVSDVVLLLHFLSLTIFSLATGRIAAKIARSELAFVTAPFLSLIVFNHWTTGGNAIMDNQFICTVPAMALGALATERALGQRMVQAAMFAGFASLFQVLIGLHVFIILMLMHLLVHWKNVRSAEMMKSGLFYLLFSGPMLIPVLYNQFIADPSPNPELYHYILFEFRNAHHYLPSHFPLTDYLKSFLLLAAASLVFLLGFFTDFKRYFRAYSFIIVTGAVLYFLLFELADADAFGKLQWFKLSAWLSWFCCIALAAWFSALRYSVKAETYLLRNGNTLPLALLLPVVFVCSGGNILGDRIAARYQFTDKPYTDLQKMHVWINEHTPLESVFLVPPDNDRFLCEARRSLVIGWKGIIHESWFLLPWYRTFTAVYGEPLEGSSVLQTAAKMYALRSDSLISQTVQPDYRLVDLSLSREETPDSLVLHREGNFLLRKFIPEKSQNPLP